MERNQKYSQRLPGIAVTPAQRRHLEEDAAKRRRSLAYLVKEMIDKEHGLVDGEEPTAVPPGA